MKSLFAGTSSFLDHTGPAVRPILQRSETRMTASVLKRDPNTSKVQKNAYLLGHKHTICTFSGLILFVKLQNDSQTIVK